MNKITNDEMAGTTAAKDTNDNSFRRLSGKEEKLFEILSQIKGDTLIAISIRKRLSNGSVGGFRKMISELKEQYRDCGRKRMIEVLGIEAVKLIESL